MMWVSYKEKIKNLSEKIVEVQKPIRVLDAIKWDPKVEADFFATKTKRLPKIDAEYYRNISLGFDPKVKETELAALAHEIRGTLGDEDDMAKLLVSMVDQYREIVVMLANRGTKAFYDSSRRLYGSPKDTFFDGKLSIMDQGLHLYEILSTLENKYLGREYPKDRTAQEAVTELTERFKNSFLKDRVEVRIADEIVADASAGSDVIKVKEGARFSKKDIDILEVHEGWVHVATTLNGKAQKVCKFLSKGPPRCAATQEGLATLMEILTFSTYPLRARTINDRILGVDKVEEGANFLELYEFYLIEGYTETDAFRNSMRVFRGGVIEGGAPFTKDISYCRGFIENYSFIQAAIRKGRPELIPFLFVGKLNVDDVPLLYHRSLDGIVDAPELVPPPFQDLNGLAVWMSFSNFLSTIEVDLVDGHFDSLFKKYI